MKNLTFILLITPPVVQKGIASVISKIPGVSIIKELKNPASFDAIISRHPSDFILISDQFLPGLTETYIKHPFLLEKTIILSAGNAEETDLHVKDTISMDESIEHISQKIEALVTPKLKLNRPGGVTELSEREKTIVSYVARGLTNKEIAENLFLSTHTVITHRRNITNKLGIKSASALTIYAIVNNIISIDDITNVSGVKE